MRRRIDVDADRPSGGAATAGEARTMTLLHDQARPDRERRDDARHGDGPDDVAAVHPLAPLSAAEVRRASGLLRAERNLPPTFRFVTVELAEPGRAAALDPSPPRRASCTGYDRTTRETTEAVVDLTAGRVHSWRVVPGVQPMLMAEEFRAAEELVRADPRWQAAMRRRGVTDLSLAMVDAWPAGRTGPADDPSNGRLSRPLTFVRSAPDDNGYARPVEGLLCLVDLDAMTVREVTDLGVVPLPTQPGNYSPELMAEPGNVPAYTAPRDDLRPIEVTQPQGASFTVDGHAVAWQKWRLHVGFTPREGLVLHEVGYVDRGRLRPVLHRASLSEMVVPYGDPAPTHWNKNVFDEGEYGLGVLANALELGCDCLGEIFYFDAVVNDQDGEPVVLPNAICMHEEDVGIGWKHTDGRTGRVEVRRSRRLVVSSISTVGNYEYGFFWYLYTDGTIEYEVKLTGVISTGAVVPGEQPRHGTVVAPGLYGPHHQHFFNVRLDMCVDGDRNTVYEVESAALPPGPDNPHGNAWVTTATPLASELGAQRMVDPLHSRSWRIANDGVPNALGQSVAYQLIPGDNVGTFFQEGAYALDRARFTSRHLWVTAYDPAERYAAGDYPNQHPGGAGLPVYAAADRPLTDADVVVWYTFGAHHVVRPEDWPVMPVSRIGFMLKPVGFFDGNPALDMPRSAPVCHHGAGCACCGDAPGGQ